MNKDCPGFIKLDPDVDSNSLSVDCTPLDEHNISILAQTIQIYLTSKVSSRDWTTTNQMIT